jgi:DNA-binding NtrC family response regulator
VATPAAPAVASSAPSEPAGVLVPLAEVERRHVEQVLQATAWNKARAARVLEVDIKTLNKKIRDFKLAPAD